MVANFKNLVNEVAESWTHAEKEDCLEETAQSFKVLQIQLFLSTNQYSAG